MSTIRLLESPEDLLVTKAHVLTKSGHHSTVGPVGAVGPINRRSTTCYGTIRAAQRTLAVRMSECCRWRQGRTRSHKLIPTALFGEDLKEDDEENTYVSWVS